MKRKSRHTDLSGISSTRKDLTANVKRWGHNLVYYSSLAMLPQLLLSSTYAVTREAKKPEANLPERSGRFRERVRGLFSNRSLLRKQSAFRLPGHQNLLSAAFTGRDDCPGEVIPGGTHTTAAPFADSGDTTGANNTVTQTGLMSSNTYQYYYNYRYSVDGPDHIYSFTLTNRGVNASIRVSSLSPGFKPVIYVVSGQGAACSTGTEMVADHLTIGFANNAGVATINGFQMRALPLDVPLHLFIDSQSRFSFPTSGRYQLSMQDVTVASRFPGSCDSLNPIDCTDFFVRQHYADFLGRVPDDVGYAGWQNILNNCGTSVPLPCDRVEVSSAFFRSPEFQGRGYFIYRFYATLGRVPKYEEFWPDFGRVRGFISAEYLESLKTAFVGEFMFRTEFHDKYSGTFNNPPAYVDALLQTVGLPNHPSRSEWIAALNGNNNVTTRAQVLRQLVESAEVYHKYYNEAFVIMQYFGFLHRTADAAYVDWIRIMNENGGDYRVMINGFLNSTEYRQRFGP